MSSNTTIDYGNYMHDAMRGLIQRVLTGVAETGLPGDHHFFITFDTQHPDAELADWLTDRYPEDMTIVIQHWFDNLEVGEDGFGITLNFGNSPEPLYVPYDAIITFVDPSVEFGLRFETHFEEGDEEDEDLSHHDADEVAADLSHAEAAGEGEEKTAEVVSLDQFRKS